MTGRGKRGEQGLKVRVGPGDLWLGQVGSSILRTMGMHANGGGDVMRFTFYEDYPGGSVKNGLGKVQSEP